MLANAVPRLPLQGHRVQIDIAQQQRFAYQLSNVLGNAVESGHLGQISFAPVKVRLTPHDVVQPDLLYICRDRLHIYRPQGVVEGPPDLLVEIITPSSRALEEGRKAKLYAEAGVPEHWLADPDLPDPRLYVLRDGLYKQVMPEDGHLRSTVIPDLVIEMTALFADLES